MTSFRISTDKAQLDVPLIHRFLAEQSTWAKGIPLAMVERSTRHSLCFGRFFSSSQVAFAQIIFDYALVAQR